ncbi:PepSY domain-containing protein [Nesterenkonia flava]|uniref:PepSY domain-containing protein n=1 Tax=Nesterenkonia flava TaxID=469799 RepID=A0ABU1FSM2_9MICC|nr:PepSY domain-containing protein [Nesterenkonia flava]MDR5711634.1 PepSY domain-containing protein [Nesterenkonia flava]
MTTTKRTAPALLSVTAAAALALSACAPENTTDQDQNDQANDTDAQTETGTDTTPTDDAAEDTPGAADETPADDQTDEATTDEPTDEATDDATDDPQAGGEHHVYQAIEAALEEYPDGVITEFQDNTDDDGYVEIFVYDGETEWELEVDSESFQIIDTEDDGIDDDDREKAEAVEIEIAEAIQTAEDEAGAEPYQGELDTEDGTVVWEIELTNGTEVYVDVATGDVVKVDS